MCELLGQQGADPLNDVAVALVKGVMARRIASKNADQSLGTDERHRDRAAQRRRKRTRDVRQVQRGIGVYGRALVRR